eukprot:7287027-Prymnesium_polylepis.1
MEAAFGVRNTCKVKLSLERGQLAPILADFDLTRMTFGDLPVRRSKGDDPDGSVEYWDDYSFAEYDKFTTNLVVDAIKLGRPSVAFYVGDDLYTIDIGQGLKRVVQINTSTGCHRPLFVEVPTSVCADDVDELVISPEAEQADDVPSEFCCPITMAIMTTPVIAAD